MIITIKIDNKIIFDEMSTDQKMRKGSTMIPNRDKNTNPEHEDVDDLALLVDNLAS